jgi:hypothetical protein
MLVVALCIAERVFNPLCGTERETSWKLVLRNRTERVFNPLCGTEQETSWKLVSRRTWEREARKSLYSNPLLVFYGIFFAYMPYP